MSSASRLSALSGPVPVTGEVKIDFAPARHSYVILSSKRVETDFYFDGNRMTCPPVHQLGPCSETDADGDLIPGTYVIEDIYTLDPALDPVNAVLTFDAQKAVCHILGLRPGSDGVSAVAASPYALSGLSLLPRHPTKEVWKAAAASGEERVFLHEVERSRQLIRDQDEINGKRKAAGEGPIMLDLRDYERAKFVMSQYNELVKKQVESELAPHQVDRLTEDIEMEAAIKARALEIATKMGEQKTVDKTELAKSLLNDPEVRAKLQKEYRIRKRGSMALTQEQLREAKEAGEDVSDVEK